MKIRYFVPIILVMLSCVMVEVSAQSGWRLVNRFYAGCDLYAVARPSDSTIVAVGAHGAIHLSFDGGGTWRYFGVGIDTSLRAVAFLDRDVGVAVGDGGAVARTVDGGASWSLVQSGSAGDLRSVAIRADGLCIAVGRNGVILRSTDSAQTWRAAPSTTTRGLNHVLLTEDDLAYAVGDRGTFLRSGDRGIDWQQWILPTNVNYVRFAFTPTAWHVVGDSGRYFRSINQGFSWHVDTLKDFHQVGLLRFFDDTTGLMLARMGPDSVGGFAAWRTSDDGVTWSIAKSPSGVIATSGILINAVEYSAPRSGVGVGAGGTMRIYRVSPTGRDVADVVGVLNVRAYNDVSCSSDGECIAVGAVWLRNRLSAFIERTTDGGETWREQAVPFASIGDHNDLRLCRAAHSFDSLNAIVVGDSATVLRTSDAGATWTRTSIDGVARSVRFLDVSFSDRDHGAVLTDTRTVYTTADGGATWKAKVLTGADGAVCRFSADRAVVLASGNAVYTTADAGVTWAYDTLGMTVYAVQQRAGLAAVDSATGFIAGRRRTDVNTGDRNNCVLLKTTDGGGSWQPLIDAERDDIPFGLMCVAVADRENAIVTGWGDAALRTRDGGATWESQPFRRQDVRYFDASSAAMLSPGRAVAVGTAGQMLLYREEWASGVDGGDRDGVRVRDVARASCSVQPNPVTGVAEILLDVPSRWGGKGCGLELRDAFGRPVADFSGQLHELDEGAVRVSVRFDAIGLPAGLYFLRLAVGEDVHSVPVHIVR